MDDREPDGQVDSPRSASSMSTCTSETAAQIVMTDEEAIKWFREWSTQRYFCESCGYGIVPVELALQVTYLVNGTDSRLQMSQSMSNVRTVKKSFALHVWDKHATTLVLQCPTSAQHSDTVPSLARSFCTNSSQILIASTLQNVIKKSLVLKKEDVNLNLERRELDTRHFGMVDLTSYAVVRASFSMPVLRKSRKRLQNNATNRFVNFFKG